ncbi:diacylglycerol kinase family protein [Williamsia sp. CHRR-6]|uniref:diacylglycerol/lipid kinase family protein n=1 Tax=Williamsia sp. CHRR-6 TaxID=2835871 RepID=UPI001BDB62FF|nr:YegS/Rv2252/BmrU family lipid kinase [Williamsia sp. CHRR-6]MBT0567760.1 YegS/Rv2252/BmrU family lipid kinase [Williamsia sp. CHRR-6]
MTLPTAAIRTVIALTNPTARNGQGAATIRRALRLLDAAGVGVAEWAGTDADDARVLARRAVAAVTAGQADAVVVIGGDGTIAAVLAAVAGTDVPVGLIPAGTGNDHARALGIPVDDLDAAVAVIAGGRARRCDLGRVSAVGGSAVFGTVVAIGLDAAVTQRAVAMRRPRGQARYPLAALAAIATLERHSFTVTTTVGGEPVSSTDELIMVSIGNTATYGGGMRICPDAAIDDAALNVTTVAHAARVRLLGLFPTIYRGTHVRRREVQTATATTVEVSADPPVPVSADGDVIGTTPARIDVLPAAVTFLVR